MDTIWKVKYLKISIGSRKGFNPKSLEDIDSLFWGPHYPFDYPFKTDDFCMYSLMGKTEPDFNFPIP